MASLAALKPGGDADRIQAEITREQFEDWKRRFAPFEDELYASLTPEAREARMSERLARASELVDQQQGVAQASLGRDLGRYGVSLTPEQRQSMNRRLGLSQALSRVNTLNSVRRGAADRDEDMMRAMIGTGRELAAEAGSAAGSAASMQADREMANRQLQARRRAQRYSDIGTLAGLGMLAFSLSSRKVKQNIKPVSRQEAKKTVRDTKVKKWNYKPGLGLPRERMLGPVAEEAPRFVRSEDGKRVNQQNMLGMLMVAQQDTMKRLDKLEKKVARHG